MHTISYVVLGGDGVADPLRSEVYKGQWRNGKQDRAGRGGRCQGLGRVKGACRLVLVIHVSQVRAVKRSEQAPLGHQTQLPLE